MWTGTEPPFYREIRSKAHAQYVTSCSASSPVVPFVMRKEISIPVAEQKGSRPLGTRLPAVLLLVRFAGLITMKNSRIPAIFKAGSVVMYLQS